MASTKGWDILGNRKARKMGKRKDLGDFDKGQIVMARRLGKFNKSGAGKDNQ